MKTKLEILKENFEFSHSLSDYKEHLEYYNSQVIEIATVLGMSSILSNVERDDHEKELELNRSHRDAISNNIQEIIAKLIQLDISENDYEKYCQLNELYRELSRYDTIRPGCTCGCGGETITYEDIEDYENSCRKSIYIITEELNR